MAEPAVSVILPTYDRLQYLPAAIESVLAQTLRDWELLIADDGSAPETQDYLAGLESPRIRVLHAAHSGNPGAVRNRAIRAAHGRHIAFLDSDDYWRPGKLATQLAAVQSHPQCQWSYTEFTRVSRDGSSLDFERDPARVLFEGDIFTPLLRLRAGVALPTVMVRRSLLDDVGAFDERLVLHEDYDLWLRLALRSPVTLVREPLTCVRRHDQHFSARGVPVLRSRLQVLEKLAGQVHERALRREVLRARALAEAALAACYASGGERGAALRTLGRSCLRSLRIPAWYPAAARAVARLAVPAGLLARTRRTLPRS